jgi:hypothetical protein
MSHIGRAKKSRHHMVHNTVRMRFGKVRTQLVVRTSLLNWKQAGMKRSLLYGISLRRQMQFIIKMTRSPWFHLTDLYQECA